MTEAEKLERDILFEQLRGLVNRIKDISYRASKIENDFPSRSLDDDGMSLMIDYYIKQLQEVKKISWDFKKIEGTTIEL